MVGVAQLVELRIVIPAFEGVAKESLHKTRIPIYKGYSGAKIQILPFSDTLEGRNPVKSFPR